MPEKIKVHAFGVAPVDGRESLAVLLEEISRHSLADRVRLIKGTDYRIDHIELRDDGLWYIDFGKFRSGHGPGAASKETPVRGFDFLDDEVFCEETAFIYDPESNHAIIQYNHYGARAGAIQEYFNSFAENEIYIFEFRPKYDDDAERRFTERVATKKISFAIDPRFLTNNDREAGTALAQAIDIGNSSNGTKIELSVSVGRERERTLSEYVNRTAVALKLKAEENPDAITRLEVGILSALDAKIEIVDLIAHRLSMEFNDLPIGADLRIPKEDRFMALKRSYNGWRRLF